MAAAGGQVSVSARRSDRLEQLVAEMGTGYAVPGDATNPDDARTVAHHDANEASVGVLVPPDPDALVKCSLGG